MTDAERFRSTVESMANIAQHGVASFFAVDDKGNQASWSRENGFWQGRVGQHPRRLVEILGDVDDGISPIAWEDVG